MNSDSSLATWLMFIFIYFWFSGQPPSISLATAQEQPAFTCYWNSDLCRRLPIPVSCPAYSTLHIIAREICEWFFVRVSSSIQWFSVQSYGYESEMEHHGESFFKLGFWDRGDGHMERKQEPQWPQCCPRHLFSPSAECIFIWSTSALWILYQEGCCLMNLCVPGALT